MPQGSGNLCSPTRFANELRYVRSVISGSHEGASLLVYTKVAVPDFLKNHLTHDSRGMIPTFAPVAHRPLPGSLIGAHVRLDPLVRDDLPELYDAIGNAEVFAGGFGGGSAATPHSLDEFIAWAHWRLQWRTGNVYAVRSTAGRVVGTSTLTDFNEQDGLCHIGWTAFAPDSWGTAVNPEAKLLMLGLAFESGYGRVRFMADERNDRSRAAIAKLGATFEGISRRIGRRVDGSWLSLAEFSILDSEWPDVRAGLLRRLAVFDAMPSDA